MTNNTKAFAVDARVILNLGRHSIKDHTTAIVELVKNSYDADATVAKVKIYDLGEESYISIGDNGFGMSAQQLSDNWLRIGFSDKRENKISEKNRRKTGEKGIGRISTDRLGALIQVISKSKNSTANGLEINWDDFDVEGKSLEDIVIKTLANPEIDIPPTEGKPSKSGTEIIIRNLRQSWTSENIRVLYDELATLTNPFSSVDEFAVELETNIENGYTNGGRVKSNMLEIAEIELNAIFDGSNPEITFTIKDKYNPKGKIETINWDNIITGASIKNREHNLLPRCGPVEVKLYFYLNSSSLLSGTKFKLSDLRTFLSQNAGVRVYRDSIAVKPYGYTNGQSDWLGLAERKAKDPAGISRETYKLTPNQLVGAVFISRDDNSSIIDSGAREGLIENEAFSDLKDLLLGCIRILETHRYNSNKLNPKIERISEAKTKADNIKHITTNLNSVKDDLLRIGSDSPQLSLPLNSSIKKIDESINEAEKVFDELLSENRVLNGLATLGISAAVFGHETQTAINQVSLAVKNIREEFALVPLDEVSIEEEISAALKSSKTIAAWGRFALTRVQVEKRKLASKNIKKIIEDTVKEIRPSLEASDIEVDVIAEQLVSRVYPMDIESIIINLITNSFTACTSSSTIGQRKIRINLAREDQNNTSGYTIKVSDSGPGIHQDLIDRIWEPLFSTKSNNSSIKTGTGLGLSIVKSIVDELKGFTKAGNDSSLGGALIEIWIPRA